MAWGDVAWLRRLRAMGARKKSYQLALSSPAGHDVLIDLSRFCRANETCFQEDARKHAVLEGRREVWLRIQNHLGLSPEALMSLYDGRASYEETSNG